MIGSVLPTRLRTRKKHTIRPLPPPSHLKRARTPTRPSRSARTRPMSAPRRARATQTTHEAVVRAARGRVLAARAAGDHRVARDPDRRARRVEPDRLEHRADARVVRLHRARAHPSSVRPGEREEGDTHRVNVRAALRLAHVAGEGPLRRDGGRRAREGTGAHEEAHDPHELGHRRSVTLDSGAK